MTAQLVFAQVAQLNGIISFPQGPASAAIGATAYGSAAEDPMEQYITGTSSYEQQLASTGGTIPGQQSAAGGSFGYKVQPRVPPSLSQLLAASTFTG
jgi:hypothetical protein